jgi:hypothetical protein
VVFSLSLQVKRAMNMIKRYLRFFIPFFFAGFDLTTFTFLIRLPNFFLPLVVRTILRLAKASSLVVCPQ